MLHQTSLLGQRPASENCHDVLLNCPVLLLHAALLQWAVLPLFCAQAPELCPEHSHALAKGEDSSVVTLQVVALTCADCRSFWTRPQHGQGQIGRDEACCGLTWHETWHETWHDIASWCIMHWSHVASCRGQSWFPVWIPIRCRRMGRMGRMGRMSLLATHMTSGDSQKANELFRLLRPRDFNNLELLSKQNRWIRWIAPKVFRALLHPLLT